MIRFVSLFACLFFATFSAAAKVEVQEITTPGGIKVWLVSEPSIPFIALDIAFQGGTSLDAVDKGGAINLMTGLLEEGAGDMDAAAFLRASEEFAASFGFSASRDQVSITAQVLSKNKEQALDLLKQAIVTPAFNEVAVERVRSQVLSSIRAEATDPDAIARKTMNALAFPNHPYGRPSGGTETSVASLTLDDLRAAQAAVLAKDRMFVSVVGDITAKELGALLDNLLGDLPQFGAAMPPKTVFAAPGGITVVDFETPQSVAVFGHKGIDRDHGEFFPAYVMNHIMGGSGFTSRLTTEVREKRGLTYGVYSYLAPYDLAPEYSGGVASANDRIKETIEVIRTEWTKMANGEVTDDELEAAKRFMTGAYPLRFDGNGRIAAILTGMQIQGLPVSYIETRNSQVEAVTKEAIARVAQWLLQPDKLQVVIVGQPKGLETGSW